MRWIAEGFRLFRRSPLNWMMLSAIWLLVAFALVAIPTLGQLILYLLTPALGGGLLLGCRALEQGGRLLPNHLVAGLQSHAAPLVTVGGVYLIGNVLAFGAFMALGGGKIIAAALQRSSDPGAPPPNVPTDPLLAVFLLLPLFMAVIFAPALVVFRRRTGGGRDEDQLPRMLEKPASGPAFRHRVSVPCDAGNAALRSRCADLDTGVRGRGVSRLPSRVRGTSSARG